MARTPVWRSIFETLRGEIVNGDFNAGDKLPTEKDFSERFGVNRHTVRRALGELAQAGVISVRRGSGAYVSEGVLDFKIGPRMRFNQNVLDLGRTPSVRLIGSETMPCQERIAAKLSLRPGKPVARVETVGEADGTPVCVSEHFFPAERFPDLAAAVAETQSIAAAMSRYGVVDDRRAWTRIAAVAPSRVIAKKLCQPDNAPVLRAEALNLDMAGQAIEYAVSYFAGQRVALTVENRDSVGTPSQIAASSAA